MARRKSTMAEQQKLWNLILEALETAIELKDNAIDDDDYEILTETVRALEKARHEYIYFDDRYNPL